MILSFTMPLTTPGPPRHRGDVCLPRSQLLQISWIRSSSFSPHSFLSLPRHSPQSFPPRIPSIRIPALLQLGLLSHFPLAFDRWSSYHLLATVFSLWFAVCVLVRQIQRSRALGCYHWKHSSLPSILDLSQSRRVKIFFDTPHFRADTLVLTFPDFLIKLSLRLSSSSGPEPGPWPFSICQIQPPTRLLSWLLRVDSPAQPKRSSTSVF